MIARIPASSIMDIISITIENYSTHDTFTLI